ncbi:DMT family transporter [Vibrio alginolyticus]|uniref:DMT family transporter n=1 Tax=Vibrio alginolyticus TaxID=663 RepID=UPI003D7E338A
MDSNHRWLFLHERLTIRKLLAVVFGLIGVVVILKPGVEVLNPSAFIVLGSAFCYAISHASTKSLSVTENPLTILFFMCVVQLPIGLILSVKNWITPTSIQFFWLIIIGGTALTAHYCMAKAMQYAEVSVVVILDFIRLPAIGVVGAILYGEDIELSLLVGALLMLLGNLLVIFKIKGGSPAGTSA